MKIYIFLSIFLLFSCASKKRDYSKEKVKTLEVRKVDSVVFVKKDTTLFDLSELLNINYNGGYFEIEKTKHGFIVKSDSTKINYSKKTEEKKIIVKDSIRAKINVEKKKESKEVSNEIHKTKSDTSIWVYLSISFLIAFFMYLYKVKRNS